MLLSQVWAADLLPKCGNKIVVTQDSSFFRQRFFQRFHHGHTGAGAVQCQRSAGGILSASHSSAVGTPGWAMRISVIPLPSSCRSAWMK